MCKDNVYLENTYENPIKDKCKRIHVDTSNFFVMKLSPPISFEAQDQYYYKNLVT